MASVLFVASECAPFLRTGGLGDVVGALPVALSRRGHDVRIVIPRYDRIPTTGMRRHEAPLGVPLGDGEAWCAVYETTLPGSPCPVYMLDHHGFFGRGYVYDPPGGSAYDNLTRFAFLCRGATQLAKAIGFTPDVFHVHDWPSALVPLYLNTLESAGPLSRSASVLTIHNLAHQAKFPAADFGATQLPPQVFRADGLEDHGQVNVLKGGAYHATMITTVSPRYAEEIRTKEGGAGLDGVMRFRGRDLVGVLNGIDETVWNPAKDPHTAASFDATNVAGKALCKRALQREMRLMERADVPLIGVLSRLTGQKGTDVIEAALPRILGEGAQMVLLGEGDGHQEAAFRLASLLGGGRFHAVIGFDDPLAHRIEAGADLFLMPSRFEPCGLNQMYSQRYGTLPIVRATGGLDDTVEQCDPTTGGGTGFKFWDLTPDTLLHTVRWALRVYREMPDLFRAMQVRAMQKSFGWDVAAARYTDVYDWAVARRRGARNPGGD